MRKQYHSRRTDEGVLIWDVDRLVEASKDLPVTEVPLTQIRELDEQYWFDGDHMPTCRAILEHMILVRDTDLKYPIILSSDGRVMDGMHRVLKAALEERETIPARRFEITPEPDFVDVDIDTLPYD